ncbi:hypothetical protein AB4543_19750 [Vibrio splendidus]
MPKVYYITRSYTHNNSSGGALMREGAVKQFIEHGYEIEILSYASEPFSKNIHSGKATLTCFDNGRLPDKPKLIFQRLGIFEDYLINWSKQVVSYLCGKVNENDILFCTSGGDLASLMVGYRVKETCICKLVINFRDPISYSTFNGYKLDSKFHVSRDKLLIKYTGNCNLIVTSCNSYKEYLEGVVGGSVKIVNNYFGYISKSSQYLDFSKASINKEEIKFIYGGTLGSYQGPNYVNSLFSPLRHVSLDIYGHNINSASDFNNVNFYSSVGRGDYLIAATSKYQGGVVSLINDYFGACIPSKIYEYINLGLPIFGILPDGEAKNIINENGYGVVVSPNQLDDLRMVLDSLYINSDDLMNFNRNILRDRNSWSMEHNFGLLLGELNEL